MVPDRAVVACILALAGVVGLFTLAWYAFQDLKTKKGKS